MSIDDFLEKLKLQFAADPTARTSLDKTFEKWISESNVSEAEALDSISERLAYGYSTKELDFEFCSALMRRLRTYAAKRVWPPLFVAVFVAFDSGEFYHEESDPRDVEPSELHTRPLIDAILCRLRDK